MSRFAIIERDGERQHVLRTSLAGYDGWTVVEDDLPAPPKEHAIRKNGRWAQDPEQKAAAERRARAVAMPREELVDRLIALEERMAKMEADLAAK